jgi:hypothetical protein
LSLPISSLPISSLPIQPILPISSLPIWRLLMGFGLECVGLDDAVRPSSVNGRNTILAGKGIWVEVNEPMEGGVGL